MDYELKLNVNDAVLLANRTYEMAGAGAAKKLREEIRMTVLDVFPESQLERDKDKPGKSVKRVIKITSRQMTALSHGIIDFVNREDTNGALYDAYKTLAEKVGLKKYFDKTIKADTIDEFDEEWDFEPKPEIEDVPDVDGDAPGEEDKKEDVEQPEKIP